MSTLFGADEPQMVAVWYFGGPNDGASQPWPLPLPPEFHVPIPVVSTLMDPVDATYALARVARYVRVRGTYRYDWAGYR